MSSIRCVASRREAIAGAGAMALATGLSSFQAAAAAPGVRSFGPWVSRIGLAVVSLEQASEVGQSWLGTSRAPARTASLSPSIQAASFGLPQINVEVHAPAFDDHPSREAFFVSSMSGHVVELESDEPDLIAERAQVAGVRLFRDQTIFGRRLIQLDPELLGIRFQIIGRAKAGKPRSASGDEKIGGLVVACDKPKQAAALAGAIFDAHVAHDVVQLPGCPVKFVGARATNRARGLVRIDLARPIL